MFQSLSCETYGQQHEWTVETVAYDEARDQGGYGSGEMVQRVCLKCQSAEYIRHTAKNGTVTDIEDILVRAGLR